MSQTRYRLKTRPGGVIMKEPNKRKLTASYSHIPNEEILMDWSELMNILEDELTYECNLVRLHRLNRLKRLFNFSVGFVFIGLVLLSIIFTVN